MNSRNAKFEELLGETIIQVEQIEKEEILFHLQCGARLRLWHDQDCCEEVWVEDICGDLGDICGYPVLLAEEVVGESERLDYSEYRTWTFYKISTIKGSVTIRWCGESNGYYSETVDCSMLETIRSAK